MMMDRPYVTSENVILTIPSHRVEHYCLDRAFKIRHYHSAVSCNESSPLDPSQRTHDDHITLAYTVPLFMYVAMLNRS